jgi:hypothetical protein
MNAVASRNVKFVSHSDQGGRGDGVQIMVHRGYAYIGHGYSNGISVLDVRDPKNPRPVAFLPCPPDTRAIHLQTHDDLLLAVPGMWTGGGETPSWPKGRRYALHHALVAGNLAYAAWRDGGLTVLDVGDPTRPKLLAHRNLDPPFGGGTHSPLPLPDRNLLVLADEANFANCSQGLRHTWLFDVREPTNPVSFATMPVPSEADYCAKGGNFGPHNLWENRPGAFQSSRFVFATYHNAGVRVFDIENPLQPREAGFFVPPDPERMFDPRPNRPKVIQSADCFVDAQGVMYLTDNNAGLYVLQFEGA